MIEASSNKRLTPFPLALGVKTVSIQPQQAVSPLQFGAKRDTYATAHRIPDEIYGLFNKAPKNELHVHQGGSSSVEFLSYSLRRAIENNEVDELPYYKANGKMEMVRLKTNSRGEALTAEQRLAAKAKVLQIANLRQYYRCQAQSEEHRPYMDSADIAETTAKQSPKDEVISAKASGELMAQKERGLNNYRQTSSKINPYVKNNPAAYMLAHQYATSVALENMRYTEYRVSPSGNGIGGANGSSIEEVLSNVSDGFEDAKRSLGQRNHNLDYGLLVLFERQNRPTDTTPDAKVKRAIELAKDVVRLKAQGKYNIAGVDLAGDEANNPVSEFKAAFQVIKDYNATAKPENRLGITIHAGETTKSGSLKGHESIATAIDIASDKNTPVRIGHGLQVINSSPALQKAFAEYRKNPQGWGSKVKMDDLLKASPLLKRIIDNNVVLEMCPKSNLQTYGIHPGFPDETFETTRHDYSKDAYGRHPAVFLSRLGVKVAISSDNRTISNTDSTNEFVKLFKYGGLTYQDFKRMVMNGFEGAFVADPAKKAAIIRDARKQFAILERTPESIKAMRMMKQQLSIKQRWILLKSSAGNQLRAFIKPFKRGYKQVTQWISNQLGLKKNHPSWV